MKLCELINLSESGNTRANIISWSSSNNKFIGGFTDNGVDYQIHIVHYPTTSRQLGLIQNKQMYNIQFCVNDPSLADPNEQTKITNYRNSIRVFGIIQSETMHKFKNEGITPDILILSISTNANHNSSEQVQARLSLYSRIAKSTGVKFGLPYIYSPLYTPDSVNVFMTNFEIPSNHLSLIKNTMKNIKKIHAS